MDPHLLRTFVAVLEHRSFSTAASVLGYTQSAVSQHIAALEADLGARLVERRPVAPTEAGARLMEHAPALLLRLDAARADIARLHRAPDARLTLACSPATFGPALARALARLRAEGPVDVDLHVLGRDSVLEAVLTARADLGLVDGVAAPSDPLPLPDLGPTVTLAVTEEPLAVLFPHDHPWRGGVRSGCPTSRRRSGSTRPTRRSPSPGSARSATPPASSRESATTAPIRTPWRP